MKALATLTLALALTACAERVAPAPDATVDVTSRDASLDDGPIVDTVEALDAVEVLDAVRVRTCSELRLREVTAAPGRADVGYPGSHLTLRGDDLASINRVTVGGVEMPFARVGDDVTTAVPPMLAVGEQAVIVASERCSASRAITVSRLLACASRAGGRLSLLDWVMLDAAGAIETGLTAIEQATFTVDGAAVVLRDHDGRMVIAWVSDGRVTPLPVRAAGPFALAQGTVVPTQGLLATPTGSASGLLRVDTDARTVTSYGGPSNDPVGVATSLDGFRALVLDRSGVGYALNRPFAATPAWSRFGDFTGVLRPSQIVLEQGGAVAARGPLAVVYDDTDPPALLPLDSLAGTLGARVELRGAAGGVYFLSGDVVAMDSHTHEVLTVDITDLEGVLDRHALVGESPVGVVRTQTAVTLYKLGAVTLRMGASGVAEAAALHVIDYHREPAVEERQVAIAGLRGVAGLPGAGNPFVVWTAREVMRVRGDDGQIERRHAMPSGDGDVGLVVVHH